MEVQWQSLQTPSGNTLISGLEMPNGCTSSSVTGKWSPTWLSLTLRCGSHTLSSVTLPSPTSVRQHRTRCSMRTSWVRASARIFVHSWKRPGTAAPLSAPVKRAGAARWRCVSKPCRWCATAGPSPLSPPIWTCPVPVCHPGWNSPIGNAHTTSFAWELSGCGLTSHRQPDPAEVPRV